MTLLFKFCMLCYLARQVPDSSIKPHLGDIPPLTLLELFCWCVGSFHTTPFCWGGFADHMILQIIQAIEEWSSGDYQPVFRQYDLSADRHFRTLQNQAEKMLEDTKNKWPNEWREFCQSVREFRPGQSKRAWSMRGLPA